MNNDRKSHRTAMAIFAVILAVAMIAAFITTIEGIDTKQARNVAQPEAAFTSRVVAQCLALEASGPAVRQLAI